MNWKTMVNCSEAKVGITLTILPEEILKTKPWVVEEMLIHAGKKVTVAKVCYDSVDHTHFFKIEEDGNYNWNWHPENFVERPRYCGKEGTYDEW